MNDTILKDIRDHDKNEIRTSSPNTHERTLNSLAHEWSMFDIFEINGSEGETQCANNKENETDLQTKVTKQNIVTHSQNMLNETNSHWQDNKAFTQLDPCELKDNILVWSQITQRYENCFEKTISTEIVDSMHMPKNEQQNIKLIKRNSDNCSSTVQHKICCLDNQIIKQGTSIHSKNSVNNDTFYGLPNKVKELFLQIRSINSLYQWQDECLNLDAVKNRKNLIYALPTSGGKTLVAEILMLQELICNKRNAIFILPSFELNFLIEEYAASKGTYPPKKRRKKNSIYMCTIEKALSLINSLIEENRLNEIGIMVIDELHLLGESGGRGATLEVLLTKILYVNDNIHIVAMSATIGNLDEIATFLNAELYTGNFRPVEIKEYVKCEENIWLLDFKTEELLTDVKKINYRYSNDAAKIDPDRIGGLVMDVIPENSCLIFCSSRKNCENVALLLSRILFKSLEDYKKVEKENLLNALKTEEGLCPILHKTIKVGVAYHHSGLTSEERRLLEDAFKAGTLCVICCTSTLATGVNLPARRVILRSPYVGNQFLNLSRYKQMVGRAGRAGMGNIGESILICKNSELEKVIELLRSKMDDSLSTIHVERDRGIHNLILSAILLRIATTRLELHKIAKKTLLNIQQKRLNVNIKQIVDETLSEFIKANVMKIKRKEKNFDKFKPNIKLCSLGRAAMKACINMQCAYTLYQDLKKAQEHLILIDHLHLLYLVTPYDLISQIKIIGTIYYDVVISLSETQMKTARLLGINEANISKIRNELLPKDVEPRVIRRFYITLILYDLWSEHAVYAIAEKYEINRGIVQNLLTAVSSFASSVIRFCQELDEFWAFKDLLNMFSKRLSYCCPLELETLMDLPSVKIGRARQLYNAGFKTIQIIAKAQPMDLQNKIPYLSKKTATQIIAAAKLHIVEKLEDLKDETQNVLDGIHVNNLTGL
ncbi:Helicase POLQ-like [Melipona quadrifasciata]|uniref:Helicase POLQ-like n=1 Tax=Melipona quadrifasciata TaxID=166423 RepID=A0A0M8ZQP8_9HYME|nr:Helicase POLQ-like [Melipona quadrifasciata]